MSLGPGALISTNVRLLGRLASGGMGEVWVANHEGLGVQVAVKLIHAELAADEQFVERFRREAGLAARLKTPHVVQVFDYGVMSDGTPYMVMELLEGESLGDRLDRDALGIDECARVVVQVCRALALAHDRGIIHRDIKPDNIFLCDDPDEGFFCKILDFGIARHAVAGGRKLTAPGVVVGTPEFLSPEVIVGRAEAGPDADCWALAVVAYYALALELPFGEGSSREVLIRTLTQPSRPLAELRPDVPAELARWFERAFSKDPAARFGSARELARSFVAAAGTSLPGSERSVPEAVRSASALAHAPTLTPAQADTRDTTTSAPLSLRSDPPIPPPSVPPVDLSNPPRRLALAWLALAVGLAALVGTALIMRLLDATSATIAAPGQGSPSRESPSQASASQESAQPSAPLSAAPSAASAEPSAAAAPAIERDAGHPRPPTPDRPDYGF